MSEVRIRCSGNSGKVVSGVGPVESLLVLVVSVLDVLRQPVLGPVDGLTVDGGLHVVQEDKELVVLHLVIHTVEVLDSTESLLLIVKMKLHVGFESVQNLLIIRIERNIKDVGKKNIMLLIKSFVL